MVVSVPLSDSAVPAVNLHPAVYSDQAVYAAAVRAKVRKTLVLPRNVPDSASALVEVVLSDAGAHMGYDARFGYSTAFLGCWVRDHGIMNLEEAVNKLTFRVASVFGLSDRGLLRRGYAADVAVFDPATVDDCAPEYVHDLPNGAKRLIARARFMRPRSVRRAPVQEIVEAPRLTALPHLKSWPRDGGRFVTFGPTLTQDPVTARRNYGLYRLQIYDDATTGMHWQSMKGGRGHHFEAERRGLPLEAAVEIGGSSVAVEGAERAGRAAERLDAVGGDAMLLAGVGGLHAAEGGLADRL